MGQVDFSEFHTKCFNIPFTRTNCNECKWINITEQEQNVVINHNQFNNHACMLYGRRLYHAIPGTAHDELINPCVECDDDGNKHFNTNERSLNET